jgi:hypothetical protein
MRHDIESRVEALKSILRDESQRLDEKANSLKAHSRRRK